MRDDVEALPKAEAEMAQHAASQRALAFLTWRSSRPSLTTLLSDPKAPPPPTPKNFERRF
jgi:hypothetical protein